MPENNSEPPQAAEPRRRNRPGSGRPKGPGKKYAQLHAKLRHRLQFVREILAEARDAGSEAMTQALINVALRTLSEE
jgi:hypothetical protein